MHIYAEDYMSDTLPLTIMDVSIVSIPTARCFISLQHTVSCLILMAVLANMSDRMLIEVLRLSMPFAVDGEDRALFTLVNGTPTLPQTLVLDREGKVIYNRVGSATAELLEDLYRQASGEDSPGNP